MLTTDADCSMGKNWLKNMAGFYEKYKAEMISGPVVYKNEKKLFEKLQSLEFLSLIVSGAGAIGMKSPVMCNGANLAFSKKAFLEVNGYESNEQLMSGDDVFLMLKIRKYFGKESVKFIKSRQAIVYTYAQKNLNTFLQQRIRWVSKSRAYTNLGIITASLIIYLFNYVLFATLILSVFVPGLWKIYLAFLLIKTLIDLPLMIGITSFAKKNALMVYFFPLQFIYTFYVSVIGFLGNLVKFSWKGRFGR